jgi:hypothetical protein
MSRLKSKFIEKEVEGQSTQLRMKNEHVRNRPLPKSFKDYAIFCIKTNNVWALLKGLLKLSKIYFLSYLRWVLRCHFCRKKQKKIVNRGNYFYTLYCSKQEKMKHQRHLQNSSTIPPIWWQNSKVSYSFFASGSSSFLDFTMNPTKAPSTSKIQREEAKRAESSNGTNGLQRVASNQGSNSERISP